jgi:RimJ/RimL family protein N-acetyltransferase
MKNRHKPNYHLLGERIYLREIQLSDVNENYHRWMNDGEITQYLESRFHDNSLEALGKSNLVRSTGYIALET